MIKFLKRTAVTLILVTLAACATQPTTGVDTAAFSAMLNKERVRHDLSPLTNSTQLTTAAQLHANDMAATNNFSHTSNSGGTPSDRARAQGYNFCFIAENIAKGQPSEKQAIDAWLKSDGHRENMLTRSATQFGVARASGNYWVLLLGRPC